VNRVLVYVLCFNMCKVRVLLCFLAVVVSVNIFGASYSRIHKTQIDQGWMTRCLSDLRSSCFFLRLDTLLSARYSKKGHFFGNDLFLLLVYLGQPMFTYHLSYMRVRAFLIITRGACTYANRIYIL